MIDTLTEMVEDSGWQDAVLCDEFELYGSDSTCKYRKVGKIVQVCGIVKPTSTFSSGASNPLFTLPEGFRPATYQAYICQGSDVNKWLCSVQSTGEISLSRYGTTEKISVSTNAWLPFSIMFLVD